MKDRTDEPAAGMSHAELVWLVEKQRELIEALRRDVADALRGKLKAESEAGKYLVLYRKAHHRLHIALGDQAG